MPRPQFSLRALLVAMLIVAAFFGGRVLGVQSERKRLAAEVSAERERLRNEAAELRNDTLGLNSQLMDLIEQQKEIIRQEKESLKKLRLREDSRTPAS